MKKLIYYLIVIVSLVSLSSCNTADVEDKNFVKERHPVEERKEDFKEFNLMLDSMVIDSVLIDLDKKYYSFYGKNKVEFTINTAKPFVSKEEILIFVTDIDGEIVHKFTFCNSQLKKWEPSKTAKLASLDILLKKWNSSK